MSMLLAHQIFIIFLQIQLFNCLPQGAPVSTCDSLMPIHGGGIPALRTSPLFQIVLQSDVIGQTQPLLIEINSGIADLAMKGFIIQARTLNGQQIGSFTSYPDEFAKTIDCGNGIANTVTHANTKPKRSIGLAWKAPDNFIGDIIFNSTIAQDYDKFWVGVMSSPVRVVREIQTVQNTISTTRSPLQPTYIFTNSGIKNNSEPQDEIYRDCGFSKTCFGVPNDCIKTKSCSSFIAVKVEGDKYVFEMRSQSKAAYIATGLSTDDKMGDDSVVECVNESGSIKAYTSWTTVGGGKFDSSRNGIAQNIVNLREGKLENGMIYCQVERPRLTTINSQVFDLSKNEYYLLIASGSELKPFGVGYHDITRAASSSALNLAEVSLIAAKSKILLQVHMYLMALAWIGTTSIGIILARYFKTTWKGSSMCGKDLWFAWHQLLMTLTLVLSTAAFIIIFVELRGWSTANNPHAILGTITMCLCFIQAFIGFTRPSPGSRNRKLFNWVHWFCGNAAHIFAIVTIFASATLEKAELPSNLVDLLLVIYVAIHVIIHILLSLFGCMSERKEAQKVTSFQMTEMNQSRMLATMKQDSPYSAFRKTILGIYILVIIAVVATLLTLITIAPTKDIEFSLV
ncbi:hypothetical protein PVAND_005515 [Polypedilum vanderplanki]|uniref:Ferric-chelate reductase 1 n=1 Tax=Polypedilum vanderplanki TaxID=319348 RepID=A0A9J6C0V4_POLVA|nr:hypothetical protein PVAND_005515 [Polypedilum vanderplanki]